MRYNQAKQNEIKTNTTETKASEEIIKECHSKKKIINLRYGAKVTDQTNYPTISFRFFFFFVSKFILNCFRHFDFQRRKKGSKIDQCDKYNLNQISKRRKFTPIFSLLFKSSFVYLESLGPQNHLL